MPGFHVLHYLKLHLADHTPSCTMRCCMCWCSRMSLQILNAENAENGENGGNIKDDLTAEDSGFFFSPPAPTGRPSILRLSQKENLPPKSVAKAMKVNFCFYIDYILSPPMISATECRYYLELESTCGIHVLPSLPPHPFLKGNLSDSSARSSNSKNLKSSYDRQTWDYFYTWWLQWRLGGWCFIYIHQCWVSKCSCC